MADNRNAVLRQIFASIFCCLILASCCSSVSAQSNIVPVGPGSYTTVRPEPCKPLPEEIFRLDSLSGPTPTNQWWSSLVWDQFSNNMFPHPLGVVACEGGLSVNYPGAAIVAADNAIMGGGVSPNGDIVIGLADSKFADARLADSFGWFVTSRFSSDRGNLKTTFGHGSPFVFCEWDSGKLGLRFATKPEVWHGGPKTSALGITVRGNHYGLFAPDDSRWKSGDEKSVALESEQRRCSIALLPDKRPETFGIFQKCAQNHVTGTSFRFEIESGELVTTWTLQPESGGTLTALYPHQWKYTDTKPTGQSYQSVRGEMKLITSNSFQTRVPIQGALPFLPLQGVPDRERMLKYLDAEAANPVPDFGDTYWEGKHLGKLSSLSGICESLGESERQKHFIDEIKRRLENWFVASKNESAPLFYYNKTWGTLIGSRPSYGSDVELNDHHFHYGYFVRAAAEVARNDREWAIKWAPMVELIIADIASPKANEKFPQLRAFDLYAGHSWASGHARFGDGNNQESSSESMNAWYGMMLWGEATGNRRIRDLGAFLFNTERTAVEEYWFDVSNTNFPEKFPGEAVGMVWGGKGAFATWFSGDADHIHGINWLPFTPASVYLGRHGDYVSRSHKSVMKRRENGPDLNKGWGDLVVMFGALADSETAARYIDTNPKYHIEEGNSHAFMSHWIHTLNELGTVDASVKADHLFSNVFVRNGKRTYAVYNFEDRPLKVRFSDGQTVTVDSKGLKVVE